ncbi:ATP-dependent DNA helicase RecG [Quadrisphaera granulorum]|uniref:ATP-dependent DNA helicase RecG n=1 Tax=Quadrisphaera granulorum TaxID=317664 RepID=A0A316AFL7_9ACTN|nr:ATP-dependent DNA helicase RecG [Quadrisphaera granulorum]PWJ56372.1 ATP-dependent DNA helicase RecG [Quadrisphaera granulorum]SZE95006.1 ATP-dependent DNA helicase RecG [Quadrisphaera granulorum]
MSRLSSPLKKDLGERTAQALEKAHGLTTAGDLVLFLPRRYYRRGELTSLAQLVEGEQATVVAEVVRTSTRPLRQRGGMMVEVVVTDGRDELSLAFFGRTNQIAYHQSRLKWGRAAMFSGKVNSYRGRLQLVHPEYELLPGDLDSAMATEADTAALRARADEVIPVYPATKGFPSWRIPPAVATVLDTLTAEDVPDVLPRGVRELEQVPSKLDALIYLHRPTDLEQPARGLRHFELEEAYVTQVALAKRRAALAVLPATPYPPREGGLLAAFDASLPFELTAGQQEVGAALTADLSRTSPMNRLLQGEVGSGKTVVALRAMLQVVDAGAQCALLAPTEVLAQQHVRSLTRMLGPLAAHGLLGGPRSDGPQVQVRLLTGSQSTADRRAALLDVASGDAGIVIGTHALLQDTVDFYDLGLVVVDEQHRFGVEQRDALRAKSGVPPHVLVMTATPIPRTVAMTVFGDLEVSTLTELPAGRQGITTAVVPDWLEKYVDRCWQRVREAADAGHQVYVVCPRIGEEDDDGEGVLSAPDPGERLERAQPGGEEGQLFGGAPGEEGEGRRPPRGLYEVLAELRARPELAGLRLGTLHGRMRPDDKDAAMRAFAAGELDVLVATTVVEVGVDVPGATVMVIVDAERFGLSQLHQLRGRVGRGDQPGLCLLMTGAQEDEAGLGRLKSFAETTDGFAVADLDLASRREGDVLGAAQSGRNNSSLRYLKVLGNEDLITRARRYASDLVAFDPELTDAPRVREALERLQEREAFVERG